MGDAAWSEALVRAHAKHAVALELFTIPAYLSAYYSINQSGSDAAKSAADAILTVVNEEMMHLQQACNLSNALGQGPSLTGDDAPYYPGVLRFSQKRIEITLGPANDAQIERFMAIELPTRNDPYNRAEPPPEDDYDTIGEFYHAFACGLKAVYGPGCAAWPAGVNSQVYGNFGDDGFPIVDLDSALNALDLIVLQGEGASEADPDTNIRNEPAHHYQFKAIVGTLEPGDLRPVVTNRAGLPYSTRCGRLLDFFDACHSELLRRLEDCFNGGEPIRHTVGMMMTVIDPLAHYLATTPYQASDRSAPSRETLMPRFHYTAMTPAEAHARLDRADKESAAVKAAAQALGLSGAGPT